MHGKKISNFPFVMICHFTPHLSRSVSALNAAVIFLFPLVVRFRTRLDVGNYSDLGVIAVTFGTSNAGDESADCETCHNYNPFLG